MGELVIQEFDDALKYIGGFGFYQWLLFLLACFGNWEVGCVYFCQLFMTLTPPHWCNVDSVFESISASGINISHNELRRLTLPPAEKTAGYDSCRMYDANFTQILKDGTPWPNASWPLKKCTSGWTYDFSYYYPTITSDLNWVCDEDWKPPMAQTTFFIGCLVGTPIFGILADKYGRLPITVATNVLSGVFGVASAYSWNFASFCILRFIVGLGYDTFVMLPYIILMEFVAAPYRSFVCQAPPMMFLTAALCCSPWIAYYLHNWTLFGIVVAAPQIFCILLPLVFQDSVRWLIGNGDINKSAIAVGKVAKFNRKSLPNGFSKAFEVYAQNQQSLDNSRKVTWLDVMKKPHLRKSIIICTLSWLAITMTFDGIFRFTEKIDANFFVVFTILGAVELPADLLNIFLAEKLGRKHTNIWSLVSCGLICFSMCFVDETNSRALVALCLVGRFLISVSLNMSIQYSTELIPTDGRAFGIGIIHTVGHGLAFVIPYVIYLAKIGHWLPFMIIGTVCVCTGLAGFLLPETLGVAVPDSIEEGETFFEGQPLCFNPFRRRKDFGKGASETEEKEITRL